MSKGKLYTTYFAKQKKGVGIKVSITRFPPKWLDLERENIINLSQLSPSKELLLNYKNGNYNWAKYIEVFKKEMTSDELDMQWALKRTQTLLDEGKDITMICYEKDRKTCHRSLIGAYFEGLGYEVIEIE